MKTAFLNLPFPLKLTRRYTCTYYAPHSLFPPLELMSLAAIVREWKHAEAVLIDAIAERLSAETVAHKLHTFVPDLVVFMAGIDTFSSDMQQAARICRALPGARVIAFGYLPTQFPGEVLRQFDFVDFVIMGEPELSFSDLYDSLDHGAQPFVLPGVAQRIQGEMAVGPQRETIKDLDRLPWPARSALHHDRYHEFLSPSPFTTIQSSRGCPASCTFCVRTFSRDTRYRSRENILAEVREAVVAHGMRTIRFVDDNFCLDPLRLRGFCEAVVQAGLRFQWSCLSRVDTLEAAILPLMKRAGCFRIYMGIETFCRTTLRAYQKEYDTALVAPLIRSMRRNRIESAGFFLVGGSQGRSELEDDIRQAIASGLDYAVVERVVPYPGTVLFDQVRPVTHFVLHPYENRPRDRSLEREALRRQRHFLRRFYLRPAYVAKMARHLLTYPRDIVAGGAEIARGVPRLRLRY